MVQRCSGSQLRMKTIGPNWLKTLLAWRGSFLLLRVEQVDLRYGDSVTDADIATLDGLSGLQWLDLSHTQITDAGVEHLRNLPELQVLDLSATKVTDAGLDNLTDLKGLRWLYLSRTQVTDAGVEHLRKLNRLEWLELRVTKVTDAGIDMLKKSLPGCGIDASPNYYRFPVN